MRKTKILLIAIGLLFLYPVINGLGCDFNLEYKIPGHERFGSCKFGQYTLIDYPDPEKGNGYIVLKGLYFYAFGNAGLLITGHEDHTKEITNASIDSVNNANRRFWRQAKISHFGNHEVMFYSNRPKNQLLIIPYKGKLSLGDSEH
ncbi:hypothetical protein WAX87_11545 [Photobacterium damselae subsp. damselae]|uniref:hypothetical protein n=1 Tax=Photobacterium damselae TaxID=38293 RepID=UPI00311ABECA